MRIFTPFCIISLLALTCTDNHVAGTVSDTDSGKSAMVYNPDLTPAIGAVVKIFEVADTTRRASLETKTDENGRYSFAGLKQGLYNIIAKKDSLIAFQDSIFISPEAHFVKSDTLGMPGSINAIVGLQPNHDPSTVTCQVLGTDIYCNVGPDGKFALEALAQGTYNLRLVTTLPEYTPTYVKITVESGKIDTMPDTLWLRYTGIPVVTGLTAACDTLHGVVALHWNKSSYRNLQNYLIFKDMYDSIKLNADPIAAPQDTIYIDTIYSLRKQNGPFSFNDSNDYHFKYRLCVQDNSNNRGQTYKYVAVWAVSPIKARTVISFSTVPQLRGAMEDTAFIEQKITFIAEIDNPTRTISKVEWFDGERDSLVSARTFDVSGSGHQSDTLLFHWSTPGPKELRCYITDNAGTVWRDTLKVFVALDPAPVSFAGGDTSVGFGDTIRLHGRATDNSPQVKLEWDIGNTGNFVPCRTGDTSFIAKSTFDSAFFCILKAVDSLNNSSLDTMKVQIQLGFENRGNGGVRITGCGTGINSYAFCRNIHYDCCCYIVGITGNVSYSADGITWQIMDIPSEVPTFEVIASHHDSLYALRNKKITIDGSTHQRLQLWRLDAPSTWTLVRDSLPIPGRYFPMFYSTGNYLVISGGIGSDMNLSRRITDCWVTSDMTTWSEFKSNTPIYGMSMEDNLRKFNNEWYLLASAHFLKSDDGLNWDSLSIAPLAATSGVWTRYLFSAFNKLWIIVDHGPGGGNDSKYIPADIWFSTDGTNWQRVGNRLPLLARGEYSYQLYDINNAFYVDDLKSGDSWVPKIE